MNYVEREVEKDMLKLLPVCLVSFREENKGTWNNHTGKCKVDKCFMLGWVMLKGVQIYINITHKIQIIYGKETFQEQP